MTMKTRKAYIAPKTIAISLMEATDLCFASFGPSPNRYYDDQGDLGFGINFLDASFGE